MLLLFTVVFHFTPLLSILYDSLILDICIVVKSRHRDSLRSLKTNVKPWANRSGPSEENKRLWANRSDPSRLMSDHEQFAHLKWANEWIAHFFKRILHSLIFGQKRAIRSEIKWANSQPCYLLICCYYSQLCSILYHLSILYIRVDRFSFFCEF